MSNAYDGCVLVVTEGISGLWHYHLSEAHRASQSLCGTLTMATSIPLQGWKVPFGDHFPKRPTWCEKCDIAATTRCPDEEPKATPSAQQTDQPA